MQLRELKGQDPRSLINQEIEKFKGRWYLDRWLEKVIFIWGFLSLIGLIIYGIYLIL